MPLSSSLEVPLAPVLVFKHAGEDRRTSPRGRTLGRDVPEGQPAPVSRRPRAPTIGEREEESSEER